MRIIAPLAVALAAAVSCLAPAQAAKLKVIHSFCSEASCVDGQNPEDSLVLGADGNIYGTTTYGGDGGFGTVFQLKGSKHGKWTYKQIYHFSCQSCAGGYHPYGRLVQDSAGNLYGTTQLGSEGGGVGAIYELSPGDDQWSLKASYSFPCNGSNCANGSNPNGSLTYAGAASGAPYDGVSPLYGTTYSGGSGNLGVAFTAVPNGSSFTVTNIASMGLFPHPKGGLLMDGAGHLYGGTGDCCHVGAVYVLAQSGGVWFQDQIYNFQSSGNGEAPGYGLTTDATGALFGTSIPAGISSRGVLFKIVPNGHSSQLTNLHPFCKKKNCKDGDDAQYGPTLDANGALIGTTSEGGKNFTDPNNEGGGTVYAFDGTKFKTLYNFCSKASCADGAYPSGRVIVDGKGNIFGVTYQGGTGQDGGTVFELTP